MHGWKGTFSYDNGQNKAPAFTPNSIVTGDVLFYDWGTGEGISHASMQVGIGTDQHGGLFKTPCGCADLGVLPLVTDLLDHLDGEF